MFLYSLYLLVVLADLCGSISLKHQHHVDSHTLGHQLSSSAESDFCEKLLVEQRPTKFLHQSFDPADEDISKLWKEFEHGYALNSSVLALGSVAGDVSRMQGMLGKIARGETVRIVTFGNSFTLGHGCGERASQTELQCSWPHRAGAWIKAAFPHADIIFENRGESGATTKGHLSMIGAYAHSLQQHPDLVILNSFLTDVMFNSTGPVHEKMIITLSRIFPKAQVLLLEDYFGEGFTAEDTRREMQERRREIARHYQIPMLDYGAMVERYNREVPDGADRLWPSVNPTLTKGGITEVNDEWPSFSPKQRVTHGTCCPLVHPPWTVHQYYADAVANRIIEMLGDVCSNRSLGSLTELPEPLSSQGELDEIAVCEAPLSSYSARDLLDVAEKKHRVSGSRVEANDSPTVLSGDWKLFEDKVGRPGWISTRSNSEISFKVHFGSRPSLLVTHLRSYRDFGNAELMTQHISRVENSLSQGDGFDPRMPRELASGLGFDKVILDGHWDMPYSMPNTITLVTNEYGHLNGFSSLSLTNATAELVFRNSGGAKVKIISVLTC